MDFHRPLGVVTPTLDGDVLAVLAGADVALTGRALHRRIGHASAEGTRLAAERLVRQGIVSRERVGGAVIYRLNREHLAAPSIERLATLRLELIERLRETIAAWEIHPLLVVLFGSVARGEATAESDVDILVIGPSPLDEDEAVWREQVSRLQSAVTAWTGNDTRVLELGAAEATANDAEPVLREAARDGIQLFGPAELLAGLGKKRKR
jgi:Nucleotidyltransferase domain